MPWASPNGTRPDESIATVSEVDWSESTEIALKLVPTASARSERSRSRGMSMSVRM